MSKPSHMIEHPNLRKMRAEALTAMVLESISGLLDRDRRHDVQRWAHTRLLDLFTTNGIEIITDNQRAEAGLPPRDDRGHTAQELQAIEAHRLRVYLHDIIVAPHITTAEMRAMLDTPIDLHPPVYLATPPPLPWPGYLPMQEGPPIPQSCTRPPNHDGPCNGWAFASCGVSPEGLAASDRNRTSFYADLRAHGAGLTACLASAWLDDELNNPPPETPDRD